MNKLFFVLLGVFAAAAICDGSPQPYRYDYDYRYGYDDYYRPSYSYRRRTFADDFVDFFGDIYDGLSTAAYEVKRFLYRNTPLRELEDSWIHAGDKLLSSLLKTGSSLESTITELEKIVTSNNLDIEKIDLEEEKKAVKEMQAKFKEIEKEDRTVDQSGRMDMYLQDLIKEARHQLAGNVGHLEEHLMVKLERFMQLSTRTRSRLLDGLDKVSRATSMFFDDVEKINSEFFGKGSKDYKYQSIFDGPPNPYDYLPYNSTNYNSTNYGDYY